MAHAGLSAAMRYRNSTGTESRPEKDATCMTIAEILLQENHPIHHTAQFYPSLNDIPVPGLYGPSADEQWMAR
jgi:hypothetical protein